MNLKLLIYRLKTRKDLKPTFKIKGKVQTDTLNKNKWNGRLPERTRC